MKETNIINCLWNTKVYVNGCMPDILKKLAEFGVKIGNIFMESPFLFITGKNKNTLNVSSSFNMNTFKESSYKEISVKDIMSLHTYTFHPFDKVLVRQNDEKDWHCDILSYKDGAEYVCLGHSWPQCIPYEGNEKLLKSDL